MIASLRIRSLPTRGRTVAALACAAFTLAGTTFAATSFRVEEATIADIHAAILARELTSTDLVHLYLARIHAFNGPAVELPDGPLGRAVTSPTATGLNALGTLNLRPAARKQWGFDESRARSTTDPLDADPAMPDALEVAARLDAEFARTGKLVGPLHGVVVAIKDQYDTFDMRTTSGAAAAYADDRPPDDATFVARLREAGAIILAKANMGEYASGFRSTFGGVLVNAYDTTRTPGGSSGGSATAVAANLVTVAIAEESGPSIRAPAHFANTVALSPTQELVSRDGLINIGLNTRTGPVARTVEDVARVTSVIAGYDPKDELTAFSVGRTPTAPYETFTHTKSLAGLRIGVVREYMDRSVFKGPLYVNIDVVERAIADLKELGAEIVEPPAEGLFTAYIRRHFPLLEAPAFAKRHPELFPVDASGKPTGDAIATLVDLAMAPDSVPGGMTLRDIGGAPTIGEQAYGFSLYLRQRGDPVIRTIEDLVNRSEFFDDAYEGNRRRTLEGHLRATHYDNAARLQRRFAVQQIVLQCMAELKLDAVVYPTGNIPPRKINTPRDPSDNGIGNYGMWTFLGVQGFPALTVPAGFTTEVWDRASVDASGKSTGLVGPVRAELPVGVDFLGRPFSEPVLFEIAAAYEAATRHRRQPPRFGPLER
ncbi:hypothetical protein ASA1KI_20440 [Opitutales bacterium ASA1]|uniref:amidase n=1 Tax=Congregicoccus parvus TaxID=3081749 RepID=UPI002B2A1FC0|nr:hypothetical protein ASA1KI_20440 [Opitutales bacterium ASA1]